MITLKVTAVCDMCGKRRNSPELRATACGLREGKDELLHKLFRNRWRVRDIDDNAPMYCPECWDKMKVERST